MTKYRVIGYNPYARAYKSELKGKVFDSEIEAIEYMKTEFAKSHYRDDTDVSISGNRIVFAYQVYHDVDWEVFGEIEDFEEIFVVEQFETEMGTPTGKEMYIVMESKRSYHNCICVTEDKSLAIRIAEQRRNEISTDRYLCGNFVEIVKVDVYK